MTDKIKSEDFIKAFGSGVKETEHHHEERPQGEWIYSHKEDKKKGYGGYCSVCQCDMPIGMDDWKQKYYESKFCPNRGAQMVGGEP